MDPNNVLTYGNTRRNRHSTLRNNYAETKIDLNTSAHMQEGHPARVRRWGLLNILLHLYTTQPKPSTPARSVEHLCTKLNSSRLELLFCPVRNVRLTALITCIVKPLETRGNVKKKKKSLPICFVGAMTANTITLTSTTGGQCQTRTS